MPGKPIERRLLEKPRPPSVEPKRHKFVWKDAYGVSGEIWIGANNLAEAIEKARRIAQRRGWKELKVKE